MAPMRSYIESTFTPAFGIIAGLVSSAAVIGGYVMNLEHRHDAKIASLEGRLNGSVGKLESEMGSLKETVNVKVDTAIGGLKETVRGEMNGLKETVNAKVDTAIGGMEKLAESKAKGEAQAVLNAFKVSIAGGQTSK